MDWLQKLPSLFGIGDRIGGALIDLILSKGGRLLNVEEEAEKLRRTEKRIRALLRDAEERRYIDDDTVKLWLLELKAVAFDADSLLDRLTTITAVARLDGADPSRKRKRSWPTVQLGPRQRWGLDVKIAEINDRLDEIARGRKRFRFQSGDAPRRTQPGQRPRVPESAACHDEASQVFGRAQEKEEIVRSLTSDHSIPLPVISIYGAAGIGKTTLARLVYNDATVHDFFATKIWVCLSDKCDVRNAMKMIMEAVTKVRCDALSLDILQQQLREHLSTTKFLLVIDNLWDEGYAFWEVLRCPLLAGEKGSKVLITTRNETVWKRMPTILPVHLKGLEVEECRLLLRKYAFLHGQYTEKDELVSIGRSIADGCRGSPLAAKSLGMLLSDTNGEEEEWLNILSQMRVLNNDHKILPSLQISYHHLPYNLKQLFALCCVFPIGHEFHKNEVIRLWIAEGLIQCNALGRLEVEAGNCFDKLLRRSFFETSGCFPNQRYRVPGLMHELALLVSKCEFLSIEPGNLQDDINPKLVRYASILYQKDELSELGMVCRYENIRILRLSTGERVSLKRVPSEFFLKLSCLRTLDMSHTELEELPDSVGCLTLLRYLGLQGTLIRRLPESVSSLFNLQTLDLRECYHLTELPEGLSRLVNLRHLDLHLEWDKMSPITLPRGIDKLTSLRTLSRFTVATAAEDYCNMKELRNISIRGELCLLKLEAATHENAVECNLSGKQYVENLMLQWSDDTYNNSQAENESMLVIEALRPHGKLRSLQINSYPGIEFPDWIGGNYFSYLENMRICNCRKTQLLPSLGKLPKLKVLHLEGMDNLQSLGTLLGFPSLEILTVCDMPDLQTWCDSEEAELPKLKELYVRNCPRLQNVTILPHELEKLEINKCSTLCYLPAPQQLRSLVIHEGSDELIRWISQLTSLVSLTLMHFHVMEDIQPLQHLSALKKLKLEGFEQLQLLSVAGDSGLEALSSLEFLEISACPHLQEFSVVGLQSLKDFRVHHCTNLKVLPEGLGDLESLRYLEFCDIPKLAIDTCDMVLPDSVSYFTLRGCPALESWCTGAGAQRVKAIPVVKIGDHLVENGCEWINHC